MIYFVVALSQSLYAQNRSFAVDSLTTLIDANYHPYNQVGPGDTLLFEHGNRAFILIRNFQGLEDKPIIFINRGGIVNINTDHYFGISIRNCRYFKFTGCGDIDHYYGFKITRVEHGGGIGIGERSSDFELDHVSVENCQGAGVIAKTDPDCMLTSTRDKFTQFNSIIHDNYISGVSNEGLYIGSTKYFGQVKNCNGKDTLLLPGLLDGVRIYNNIVKYTGWDGIQISSASFDCQVYDNIIMFDSQNEFHYQMSGIMLGGGSKCDCYSNFISQGNGNGIESHGLGGYRIFNNIIVNAGRGFLPLDSSQMRHGIYISDVTALTDSSFYILNNNIMNPKSDGIRFASIHSKNNLVASNLIINPGNYDFYENGNTSFNGLDSYIMLPDANADVKISSNYFSRSIGNAGCSVIDYTLLPGSLLIDAGYTDTKLVAFDFNNHSRPWGNASDIGAFEYNPESLGLPDHAKQVNARLEIFPNPVKTFLSIQYLNSSDSDVFLDIYDINGIHIMHSQKDSMDNCSQIFKIDVKNYKPGIYIFTIRSARYSVTGRFIKTE
jgi:hypothetical protein